MTFLDEHLPLCLGTYFVSCGKSAWRAVDCVELQGLLAAGTAPEFRTVLAIQGAPDFDRDMTPDEIRKVRYAGPLYFDLDGETVGEAIDAFRALLGKLRALGLELDACRLFATGGRGFHLEIPDACFVPGGLPAEGVMALPSIFREMVHALYVECMDLRVYSARKGRMWRCPNHRRDNGKFKVSITAGEALSMTPEKYGELCAAPRDFHDLVSPEFCPGLGLLYAKGRDKVSKAKPRKSSGGALRQRFGTNLPPSLEALCSGRIPARGGWNAIVMQLCTLADELGMDEETLVTKCQGLIRAHDSDGTRYNTPTKREAELRRMFAYLAGNVCYSPSVGGLRSILPAGLRANDFRGLQ